LFFYRLSFIGFGDSFLIEGVWRYFSLKFSLFLLLIQWLGRYSILAIRKILLIIGLYHVNSLNSWTVLDLYIFNKIGIDFFLVTSWYLYLLLLYPKSFQWAFYYFLSTILLGIVTFIRFFLLFISIGNIFFYIFTWIKIVFKIDTIHLLLILLLWRFGRPNYSYSDFS